MHVETSVFCQQSTKEEGGLIEPLQIAIEAASPSIAVGFLLDHARLLNKIETLASFAIRILWNLRLIRKVVSRSKRRIDVDKLHLTCELREEGGQYVLLVAPNEAVAPLAGLVAGEQIKHQVAGLG